ncbi:MAG: PIN domain-containing protein [Acidobacteriota bacterium]
MIVVDTSIWIAASKRPGGSHHTTLEALIEADEAALALPVRIELLSGVASRDRAALRRALASLPLVLPTEDTWKLVESWIEPAARAGYRFGIADWLIAAMASELGALVWSLDKDFEQLAALKLVQLYG